MVNLKLKAFKAGFFDRAAVVGAADRATRKVLSKFGAFVRQRARTSIRKRKGTSEPGRPPFSHLGLLRNFIFFAYDRERSSVVIGPALINRPSGAPENLEYGGTFDGKGRVVYLPVSPGARKTAPVKLEGKIRIRPRPYMKPALDAELPGLPAMWRDSVR